MQVDSDNFSEVLPEILQNIKRSDFVAFDCQFTGLVSQLQKIQGFFPNHIEFYERIKETAYNFRIIQLGIAAFIYHQGEYYPKVYNLFVSPTTYSPKFNNVMICEVQSLQFLAKNHMDFQRTFQKGIKAKRLFSKDQIKEHQYNTFLTMSPQKMFFSPQDTAIIKDIQEAIEPLLENNKLEKIVDLKSKTIFNYIRMKYPQILINEPKKKQQKFEYVLRFKHPKMQEYQENKDILFQHQTLESIIQAIINLKKPLIGHFPNLDIGLLYHNFLQDLPETYEQFCFQINKIFPQIYDTKVLSRRIQKKMKHLKVDLSSLFKACFNPKLLQEFVTFNTKQVDQYLKSDHHHEAGFDALMTGCAFLGMANFIANKKGQISFEQIQNENKLLYSRFSGEVSISGNKYCSGAVDYQNRIVIQSVTKDEYPEWKQVASFLSQIGSLSVHQDHREIYYVFEQPQNINMILSDWQKFSLRPYQARKIIKARNMYSCP